MRRLSGGRGKSYSAHLQQSFYCEILVLEKTISLYMIPSVKVLVLLEMEIILNNYSTKFLMCELVVGKQSQQLLSFV